MVDEAPRCFGVVKEGRGPPEGHRGNWTYEDSARCRRNGKPVPGVHPRLVYCAAHRSQAVRIEGEVKRGG